MSYIYLLAPVSLVIVNPIGFFLMEYHKQSSRSKVNMKLLPSLIAQTLRGVLFNPVVFMTALGVIVNVVVYFGIRGYIKNKRLVVYRIAGNLGMCKTSHK